MQTVIDILEFVILALSARDVLTLRQLVEGGTLILGSLGSGKTSTSFKQLACGMMRAGMGGLISVVKSSDTAVFLDYARTCGREKDVIVFSEASGLKFDPLAYEWAHPSGRGAGDVEGVIEYFSILLSLGKQHLGVNSDRFWELAAEQAMRHAIHLIKLAAEPLSIVNVYRAIRSFPTQLGQEEDATWREQSYTAILVEAIRKRQATLTSAEWEDLNVAIEFVFSRWASYDEKPRGSIEMTFAGMADKFLFSPFREIFSSGRFDFTPEQTTHERKIIIVDFPVLEYGKETARLIQTMVKLTFQRAWLRHQYKPGCCNGAFLFQDEFQLLMHRFENHFVQVCRSSAIAVVCATQTVLNLSEEMGEGQLGSKSKAYLNNLAIKIAHRTTCPDTCAYLADVIGKEYRYINSFNAGTGHNDHIHAGIGGTRQLVHLVEPIEFSRLIKPDGKNPHASAIVYCGGETFNASRTKDCPDGRNYLRVMFSRDL